MTTPNQQPQPGADTREQIVRCSTLLCGKQAVFRRINTSTPRPKCATCFARNVQRGSKTYKVLGWIVIPPNTDLSLSSARSGLRKAQIGVRNPNGENNENRKDAGRTGGDGP